MSGSVIVAGARTPIGKLSGALGSFSATDLGGFAIAAALERAGVAPDQVDYVFMGQVILAGNYLLALADDGQLVVVEAVPEAYKEVARFKAVAGKCWSTPALSNGRVFVRSTKEGACFDLAALK